MTKYFVAYLNTKAIKYGWRLIIWSIWITTTICSIRYLDPKNAVLCCTNHNSLANSLTALVARATNKQRKKCPNEQKIFEYRFFLLYEMRGWQTAVWPHCGIGTTFEYFNRVSRVIVIKTVPNAFLQLLWQWRTKYFTSMYFYDESS